MPNGGRDADAVTELEEELAEVKDELEELREEFQSRMGAKDEAIRVLRVSKGLALGVRGREEFQSCMGGQGRGHQAVEDANVRV